MADLTPIITIGAKEFWDTDLNQVFFWESNEKGVSLQFQADGSYCSRDDKGTETVLNCYFPCPSK